MSLRILLVNNVSAEPFRVTPPQFEACFEEATPTVAWKLATTGRVDLALLPVAKVESVAHVMQPIGHFGVACTGPVGSVVLMSRRPMTEFLRREPKVYLTPESQTSRRLLLALWRQSFGGEFSTVSSLEEADAHLVIGDVALRQLQDPLLWPCVTDLSEWWHRSTGLPFVFARWTIRRGVPEALKQAAHRWLDDCATHAATEDGVALMARRGLEAKLFRNLDQARFYFEQLTSRFGQEELQGEAAFLKELTLAEA